MALTAPSHTDTHTQAGTLTHTRAHTYKWETSTRIATHIVHYFHTFVWPFQAMATTITGVLGLEVGGG